MAHRVAPRPRASKMPQHVIRRLRPYLFTNFARIVRYASGQAVEAHAASNDYLRRVEHLESAKPRAEWSMLGNLRRCLKTRPGKRGLFLLSSIRAAGSKLVFVTILEDEHPLQIVLKHAQLADTIKKFAAIARKGDTYSFTGLAHRTARGQLSLLATETPALVSPSLHQIPEELADPETLSHYRHVHMLVDPNVRQVLKVRHTVERTIDDFLCAKDFLKVNTPILQAGAGGAIARPFVTQATDLHGKKLNLRIAPELWLKRLIVGGMSRIYEMGPVFRNEGVDATHNPEFTMCEFYAAHATLGELMEWTEHLMLRLHQDTKQYRKEASLEIATSFAQLEFIPTLESKLGYALPDLESTDAVNQLTKLFHDRNIPMPHNPSLPRLLDALAAHYIEPLCDRPTFITHHPVALSPLAKRFQCTQSGQWVSARAELFINHCEIANMYEEQNSPFEQRQAFLEQLKYRAIDGESDGEASIDHSYIEALEWGLPPTGGWGCGVDRLVMLLSGRSRIGDVLSFGNLRNVVGVAQSKQASTSRGSSM
ncbi:hypothetical protein AMS68_003151 [Peltaster fructicola]|uniref:Aminoacyl-transfer RNA synthetases class-II family profile domain-containing protein n=1 Tax=Peltaster fructicola TaxID=286661 RepID=A0A6H0XSC3_9PEZI|nr:hypothetical protein AMS68_003151 [Peltaster fructicola]